MPVVNDDWRDPASWVKPSVSYGAVKDGNNLRFCRKSKTGQPKYFACTLSEWAAMPAFRQRLEKENRKGAWVAVGLEPHRVMIRHLESPLKDRAKTTEIWGTLLDAAIPFSIEKCLFTFLPAASADKDRFRCLAVAARIEDVQYVISEWKALDICPDLIMPEQLLLPETFQNALWLGNARTLFASWNAEGFQGGGGSLKRDQRERVLARYIQSRESTDKELVWKECGPEASEDQNILEEALACSAFTCKPNHANLLANEWASPSLLQKQRKKTGNLVKGLVAIILLLMLIPPTLRLTLRSYQKKIRAEISSTYTELTGSRTNGAEVLLAQRYLETKWGPLWDPARKLSEPRVSMSFVEMSQAAREFDLVFTRVEMTDRSFVLNVLGTEDRVNRFSEHYSTSGWKVSVETGSDDQWLLRGERSI